MGWKKFQLHAIHIMEGKNQFNFYRENLLLKKIFDRKKDLRKPLIWAENHFQ